MHRGYTLDGLKRTRGMGSGTTSVIDPDSIHRSGVALNPRDAHDDAEFTKKLFLLVRTGNLDKVWHGLV